MADNINHPIICTTCGKNAIVAVTKCEDRTGKNLLKKGERLCMSCYKKLIKDEY